MWPANAITQQIETLTMRDFQVWRTRERCFHERKEWISFPPFYTQMEWGFVFFFWIFSPFCINWWLSHCSREGKRESPRKEILASSIELVMDCTFASLVLSLALAPMAEIKTRSNANSCSILVLWNFFLKRLNSGPIFPLFYNWK